MVLERARLRVLNAQVYSSVVDQTHLELASFSLTRTVSFKRNHRPLTFAKGRRHDQSRMHMEFGTFSSTRNHRPLTLTKGRRHDQSRMHTELRAFSSTRNYRPLTLTKGRRHDQSRMHMEFGTFSSTRNHRPLTFTKGRRHDQSSSHEQRPPRALPPLLLYKSEEGGCDVRLLMLRDHAVQAHS